MRLLVLGGTHFLGRHVVDAALDRGHEVATFTRGLSGRPPAGVRARHGDRDDAASLPVALGGWAPELVAALESLGVRVERFTYAADSWDEPPARKVAVAGRTVRTGAFRSMDRQLVSLTVDGDRRLDLLVVPPEADALTGVRALRLAGLRADASSPQRVLADASSSPRPEVVPLTGVRAG